METKPLLLEIGTEEIPARFLPAELDDILAIANAAFMIHNVAVRNFKTFATPRRLAIVIEEVATMQIDDIREVFGPPKQAAYDSDGNFTKAAIGFARSQGVNPENLDVKPKENKGEYVFAVIEEKGRPTEELLPEILKEMVLSLRFPKSMRWGDGTMRYARPIHWITALYGGDTVPFEIDGIKSGRTTRGHRFLSPGEFEIEDAKDYLSVLEGKHVIADKAEREKRIRDQFKTFCGYETEDEELVSIVSDLVESPVSVLGNFSEEYLKLPDELLTAVMKGHQKYFSVKDERGKLKNQFVVVSNTKKENADTVKRGAERVLKARFEDARFYFEEDSKSRLIDRLEGLKNVTFQEKLGSTYDKIMNVRAVAGALADKLFPKGTVSTTEKLFPGEGKLIDVKASVSRAAELSKCDLITGVVREFPELQGIMGMYYATGDGEDSEVCIALKDQYHPAFAGDYVPKSDVAAVLGLADRVHNIAAFFSIGLRPTGSEDPFALRRQALGVISIWMNKEFTFDDLFDCLPDDLKKIAVLGQLYQFVVGRVGPILVSQGYSADVIDALEFHDKTYKDSIKRLKALEAFKSHARYNDFLTAIKRVRNIVPEREFQPLDEGLLRADEEKELYSAFLEAKAIGGLIENSDYDAAFDEAARLVEPINRFFDGVLVMDKDEAVKQNRLALLNEIWGIVSIVADFSKLQEV